MNYIELLTGVRPDAGDGSAELSIMLAIVLIVLIAYRAVQHSQRA